MARFSISRRSGRVRRSRSHSLRFEALESRSLLASLPAGFAEAAIATGLSNPTAMEVAPNGDLWVLEQGGAVKRFRTGSTTADVVGRINNLGLNASGERGLLGIAFDPQFATSKQVFLYYTSTSGNIHNRLSRFTVNDTIATDYFFAGATQTGDRGSTGTPTEAVILDLDPLSATNHNGGAIHFGPDGKLYAAVGENAVPSNAQSLGTLHGKLLRMNPDGSVPSDNPFLTQTTGNRQLIWAVGLRNPFTFAFQPGTGRMFINDVGAGTWEEINEGFAGANYGWPGTEGDAGTPPVSPGTYRAPVYAYRHGSGPFEGFAITGGAFYNPAAQNFPAAYTGDYFFADFVNDWINVRDSASGAVSQFATGAGGPVDLRVAPDGSLLYLSRSLGQVLRVSHTDSVNDRPVISAITDQQIGENGTLSVPFTIGDPETAAADLTVTVQAGREALLPSGSLVVEGTGTNRTLEITPAAGQRGDALVQITVSDGELSARTTFFLIVANTSFPWHHAQRAHDVNNSGDVTAADALDVINVLNASGPRPLAAPATGNSPPPYLDVAPSNTLTALDALYVINFINAGLASAPSSLEAEGEFNVEEPFRADAALLAELALLDLFSTKKRRI
jgi:glucose/arabinose dehydrogenase